MEKVNKLWMWSTFGLLGAVALQFRWWDQRAPEVRRGGTNVVHADGTHTYAALPGGQTLNGLGCCAACSGNAGVGQLVAGRPVPSGVGQLVAGRPVPAGMGQLIAGRRLSTASFAGGLRRGY